MKTSLPPSAIVDRMEEFLVEFEDRLAEEKVDPDTARRRADKMERTIRGKLDADPILRTSMSRFEEYLETLRDAGDREPSPNIVSFPDGPRLPDPPRMPKVVKFAIAWAVFPILMITLIGIPEGYLETENPGTLQKGLVNLIVTLALTAPMGATALGLVGLRQIRFGRGSLLGETVATGIVLFYPALIAGATVWLGVRVLLAGSLEGSALSLAALAATLLTVFLTIQIGMKWIRNWFERMEASGRYWTPVGGIPPSRRPSARSAEID